MSDAPWQTIPQLVDDAARRFPGLEALADGEVRWTFPELADRVHAAAAALIATGVQHGDRVGVWAPNIPEWVVTGLAVHSTGAVLVPVNTRFKGREAADILRRAGVRTLFTVGDFLDTDYVSMIRAEPDLDLDEIVLLRGAVTEGTTSFEDFLARAASVDDSVRATRASAVGEHDVCHVLFTSGTTGAPKGVVLEHGQICRAYLVFSEEVDLREGDRYLIVNPFFHSFGLHAGILCCLMMGATIVPQLVFDPAQVMQRIADERITVFPGPPTVYQGMLSHPEFDTYDLSGLRVAILGAAALPVELVREMRERLGMKTVVTGFGITEASGLVTMTRFDDPPEIVVTTTGRPLPGVELRIVTDDGTEAAPGDQGELLVRGYNVMRGYLDDPAQTAEAVDADGWLHTGDIGAVRPDGNLVITDRKKDMFIVGGFNAYPVEIEGLMLRHPTIAQVAVVGVPDERLGEVGMAFVVPRPGEPPDPEAIIAWCRDEFANYKVPRFVAIVDALPLNATGKVLKYELRERARAHVAAIPGT
jgi:acyl-CoA synthetase (AMP-forming)/AMP-acid ligase II